MPESPCCSLGVPSFLNQNVRQFTDVLSYLWKREIYSLSHLNGNIIICSLLAPHSKGNPQARCIFSSVEFDNIDKLCTNNCALPCRGWTYLCVQ